MTFLNVNTAAFTYQSFKEEIYIYIYLDDKCFILEFIDLEITHQLIDCYMNIS